MQNKFVLWRFVGLKFMAGSGKVGVQRHSCYWKIHGVFESIDDAIVEIDRVHSRNRSKLPDASWLVTHNWKVVFDEISNDGYMGDIYTGARPNYANRVVQGSTVQFSNGKES